MTIYSKIIYDIDILISHNWIDLYLSKSIKATKPKWQTVHTR